MTHKPQTPVTQMAQLGMTFLVLITPTYFLCHQIPLWFVSLHLSATCYKKYQFPCCCTIKKFTILNWLNINLMEGQGSIKNSTIIFHPLGFESQNNCCPYESSCDVWFLWCFHLDSRVTATFSECTPKYGQDMPGTQWWRKWENM